MAPTVHVGMKDRVLTLAYSVIRGQWPMEEYLHKI